MFGNKKQLNTPNNRAYVTNFILDLSKLQSF